MTGTDPGTWQGCGWHYWRESSSSSVVGDRRLAGVVSPAFVSSRGEDNACFTCMLCTHALRDDDRSYTSNDVPFPSV